MNPRTGSAIRHRGKWYARVTITDPVTKKRRYVKRKAHPNTKTAAIDLARKLAGKVEREARGGDEVPTTLHGLLGYFEKHHAVPAHYVEGRKVEGYRSHASLSGYIAAARTAIRDSPLLALTYGMLRTMKLTLLQQETTVSVARRAKAAIKGVILEPKFRSLANAHRILATVRHALTIAVQEGWVDRNPFEAGRPLINPKDERERQRVCSRDEEQQLMAQCVDDRAHLRPILVCAFDTGMRIGEIIRLEWSDVDLETRVINVRAFNTKTMTARQVPITKRLQFELRRVAKSLGTDGRVFGILNSVDLSFTTAKRLAKLRDLRFHDIRHTAATRMVEGGMSLPEVGRILGHSEPRTTYRYVNANAETIARAAAVMERYHEAAGE